MKVYHGNTSIGTIFDAGPDGLGMCGFVDLTAEAGRYMDIFAYSDDEKRDPTKEPPFLKEMFWNWFVEKEGGENDEIGLPGVHKETGKTEIYWRYI